MKSFVSEFTFDLAATAIASMIWCADAADQCVYVNAALKSYLGRDDSEQLNKFVDHVHPDDRALVADALATARCEMRPIVVEYRMQRRNGIFGTLRQTTQPLLLGKHFLGLVNTCEDVTHYTDSRASEERLRALLQVVQEGVVAFSPDAPGFVNRSFLEIFGANAAGTGPSFSTLDEARAAYDLVDEDGALLPPEKRPMWRVLLGERVNDMQVRIRFAEGHERIAIYRGEPIFKADGSVELGVVSVRDVTEQYASDQINHRLQSDLAHISRLNSMVSFTTAIAHEINQPLASAANYVAVAKLLLRDSNKIDQDSLLASLNKAGEAVMSAADMIQRFRELSQKRPAKVKAGSISEVINKAIRLALPPGREVRVERFISPEVETILMDAPLIEQVLVNLLRNAVQAQSGQARSFIKLEGRRRDSDFAVFSVSDNGLGLADEARRNLFEPFNAVNRGVDCLGVGLSICRRIVHEHGGDIWPEESEEPGATFCFTLPLAPLAS